MTSLSRIDGLKARMQWLQARQTVISANVANGNTPGFKPLDLRPFAPPDPSGMSVAMTDAAHLGGGYGASLPSAHKASPYATVPSGNSVVLEDEMTKLADTQIDYQMATPLYTKSLGLLKIAIGKK